MPGKNSKVTKTETPVAPLEALPAQKGKKVLAAKVVESHVVVETAHVVAQKGGKKAAKNLDAVVPTPVPDSTPSVVEAATPVVTQKGGKRAAKVVASVESAAPVVAQKGGKRVAKAVAHVEGVPLVQKGRRQRLVKKDENNAEEAEEQEGCDKRIRSFKVKLPGREDFEGRFTGLTPYQAANKALSKYFRETEKPNSEITFSICESTRKSKKSVYTYVGCRQKLENPVTYNITNKDTNESREIVKHFKNSLKKVKKSEVLNTSA